MTHRNFCLVDLLRIVAMFRIFRIWVEMQNANIDLVALVEGAQGRFPDQHRALHVAVVVLHDHAEIPAKEGLVLPGKRLEGVLPQEEVR